MVKAKHKNLDLSTEVRRQVGHRRDIGGYVSSVSQFVRANPLFIYFLSLLLFFAFDPWSEQTASGRRN